MVWLVRGPYSLVLLRAATAKHRRLTVTSAITISLRRRFAWGSRS